jgi:hypothetical protein
VVLVNYAKDALRQFRPDVAEAYLRITNALYPNRPRFLLLLAFALQAQERSDCPQKKHDAEVLELLRRTSEICPTDHVNAGCYARALMEPGDYQAGWSEQRKWLAGFTYPPGPLSGGPKWDGKEPVAGQTVLLRCPDGFGDAFQYVRFASSLADQGARVIVAGRPQALGVLQTAPGVSRVVDRGIIWPQLSAAQLCGQR